LTFNDVLSNTHLQQSAEDEYFTGNASRILEELMIKCKTNEKHKNVLRLFFLHDLSHVAISDRTGMCRSFISRIISRFIKRASAC
jgi:DNA-directed RNA polymerase specialized sigma subunit